MYHNSSNRKIAEFESRLQKSELELSPYYFNRDTVSIMPDNAKNVATIQIVN